MAQQAVKQLRQLARQRDVGGPTAEAGTQAPIEAPQGFVHTVGQCPGRRTKHSPGPVAMRLDVSFTLAALFASARQSQPRPEMFSVWPAAHVRPHLADQLQYRIRAQAGNLGRIPTTANACQQLLKP